MVEIPQLARLQKDAAAGKLGMADLKGGTFSLSNIGNLGGTYTYENPRHASAAPPRSRGKPLPAHTANPSPLTRQTPSPLTRQTPSPAHAAAPRTIPRLPGCSLPAPSLPPPRASPSPNPRPRDRTVSPISAAGR